MKESWHPDFDNDLILIREQCDSEEHFQQVMDTIDREYKYIKKNPINHSAGHKFEPLKSAGYRKNKFHSVVPHVSKNADMRMIYQYDEIEESIYYIGVGWRHDEDPNIYDRVTNRHNELILNSLNGKLKPKKNNNEVFFYKFYDLNDL